MGLASLAGMAGGSDDKAEHCRSPNDTGNASGAHGTAGVDVKNASAPSEREI